MLSGKTVGLFFALLLVLPAAAVPLNEQPMFGSQPKTPDMIAADEAFIAAVAKRGLTRTQGSDQSVQLG